VTGRVPSSSITLRARRRAPDASARLTLDQPIPLTPRLRAAVERAFSEPDRPGAIDALERVDLGDWLSTKPPHGRERVLAAVLELARGDELRLAAAIRDAERDWRDVLVWGGLANGDWHARLDELLGPVDTVGEDA
jgi:hypothetical protein